MGSDPHAVKALAEPVGRRVRAELAGASEAAEGAVRPKFPAAPVAEGVASLVAALLAGDQG